MMNASNHAPPFTDTEIITSKGPVEVRARILGYASSREPWHTHDEHDVDGNELYAEQGVRCSACRWFEVTIYESDFESDDARYLVLTRGPSVVPGERTYDRVTWTDSEFDVVELLTVRQGGKPTLPRPSARALAQAAKLNDKLRDAYENRAVL